MESNMTDVLNEMPMVAKSLKSLAEVEEGFKYSWDPESQTLYRDAGIVTSFFGSGKISWVSQAATRTTKNFFWSSDSHQTLTGNIDKLRNRIELLSSNISTLVGSQYCDIDAKRALQHKLISLQSDVDDACDGVKRLKKIYFTEQDKYHKILSVYERFKQLKNNLEVKIKRVGQIIEQEEGNRIFQAALKEGRRLNKNDFRHRSLSDGTMMRKTRRCQSVDPFRPALPDGLTDADFVDTYQYLQANEEILNATIKQQIQQNPDYKNLYLKKEKTLLPRSIHFFSLKEFYLVLNKKCDISGAEKIMRFSDKKIFINVVKTNRKDSNELEYLNMFHNSREIASSLHICRFLSDEGKPMLSLIMNEYNLGTLDRVFEKSELTSFQKYQVALDLLHAVKKLHDKDIVHLNLKPQVVFLNRKSQEKGSGNLVAAEISGLEFARPSQNDETYNKSLDIWMLGHLLYYLFFQKRLTRFEFLEVGNVFDAIFPAIYGEEPLFDKPGSRSVEYLIWLMLHPLPKERPKIDDLITEMDKLYSWMIKLHELKINRRQNRVGD
jgi:hypothetical protein